MEPDERKKLLKYLFALIGVKDHHDHPNWQFWDKLIRSGYDKDRLVTMMKVTPEYIARKSKKKE